jgi:hypothetical protein
LRRANRRRPKTRREFAGSGFKSAIETDGSGRAFHQRRLIESRFGGENSGKILEHQSVVRELRPIGSLKAGGFATLESDVLFHSS